jgi:hypothetical protein
MIHPKGQGGTSPLAVMIPNELRNRLDSHLDNVARQVPGVRVTLSDVVRSLLISALERANP